MTEGSTSGVGCETYLHTMSEAGPFYIKVYVHVIRDDNGDGGQSASDVDEVFDILRKAFTPHNIYFIWDCDVNYIDEDYWFYFTDPGEFGGILDDGYEHSDGIDMFLFPDKPYPIAIGGGQAFDIPSTAFYVAGNFEFSPYASEVRSQVVAHEMGHCLGLLHTHHYTGNTGDKPVTDKELVVRGQGENCEEAGDCICDTEADNNLQGEVSPTNCTWSGPGPNDKDDNDDFFDPSTTNIMSYTHIDCMDETFTTGQGKRMRNIIATESNLQACLVDPQSITSNTTWDLNSHPSGEIYMPKDLIVKSDYSLTISEDITIYFAKHTKLIIESNAIVYLEGKLTSNSCSDNWKGIEVWGDLSESQYVVNGDRAQGRIEVYSGGTIENAELAVQLWGPSKPDYTGGQILCDSAIFRNNHIGIEFAPYKNTWPFSSPPGQLDQPRGYNASFRNCIFENTSAYPHEMPFGAFVMMHGVSGPTFLGCTFDNGYVNPDAETVGDFGYGIYATNADFRILPLCLSQTDPCPQYQNSSFDGLGFGVFTGIQPGYGETLYPYIIESADFENCYVGHLSRNVSGGTVVNNTFNFGEVPDEDLKSSQIGVSLSFSINGFTLEENTFTYTGTQTTYRTVGIQCFNLFAFNNVVRRNTFIDLDVHNEAGGYCANFSNDPPVRGLYYDCNSNTSSNEYDFLVCEAIPGSEGNRIKSEQGLPNPNPNKPYLAAGNTFAGSGTPNDRDFSNQGAGINYYYNPSVSSQIPQDFSGMNDVESDPNTCPQNYCLPPCHTQTEIEDLKERYFSDSDSLDARMEEYEAALESQDDSIAGVRASEADFYKTRMDGDAYNVLIHAVVDTVDFDQDSVITWARHLDGYGTGLALAEMYSALRDTAEVDSIVSKWEARADTNSLLLLDLDQAAYIRELSESGTLESLDPSDLDSLELIAKSLTPYSAGIAMTLLEGYGYSFSLLDCATIGEQQGFVVPSQIIGTPYVANTKPKKFNVYPNPAENKVYFDFGEGVELGKNDFLLVFDILGRIVFAKKINETISPLTWDCSQSPKGIFYYYILIGSSSREGSIVVK